MNLIHVKNGFIIINYGAFSFGPVCIAICSGWQKQQEKKESVLKPIKSVGTTTKL